MHDPDDSAKLDRGAVVGLRARSGAVAAVEDEPRQGSVRRNWDSRSCSAAEGLAGSAAAVPAVAALGLTAVASPVLLRSAQHRCGSLETAIGLCETAARQCEVRGRIAVALAAD